METALAKVTIEGLDAGECEIWSPDQLKVGGVSKVQVKGGVLPLDVEFTGQEGDTWQAKLAPLDQTEELTERCRRALVDFEETGGPITRAHLSLAFQRLVDQVGGSEVDEFCRTIICSLIAGTPIKD